MRKNLPNTEKYFRLISDTAAVAFFEAATKNVAESKQDNEVAKNIIFNRDGPREWTIKHSPKTVFIANKLFRPMSEIFSTMGAIENIAIYMNTFPYDRYKVSKLSYLRYHVENFLNEIYILEERLEAYLKIIERAYKKEPYSNNIKDILEKTQKDIIKALEKAVCIRHPHIHQHRYTDSDLDHLAILELFSKYERTNQPFWCKRSFFDQAYKKVRNKKVKTFKGIIESLEVLLESYFKVMLQVVSKDEKIVYPSNISK
jgi:hypothetical protein